MIHTRIVDLHEVFTERISVYLRLQLSHYFLITTPSQRSGGILTTFYFLFSLFTLYYWLVIIHFLRFFFYNSDTTVVGFEYQYMSHEISDSYAGWSCRINFHCLLFSLSQSLNAQQDQFYITA